jgi:hypothetical protein
MYGSPFCSDALALFYRCESDIRQPLFGNGRAVLKVLATNEAHVYFPIKPLSGERYIASKSNQVRNTSQPESGLIQPYRRKNPSPFKRLSGTGRAHEEAGAITDSEPHRGNHYEHK